jgi:hypothetical protein
VPFLEWASETKESQRLAAIAKEIFKRAVDRVKLTPQAVLAFFKQQEEQLGGISEMDMKKVRRLILHKLFHTWCSHLKAKNVSRFKASQVLTRVARRVQERVSPREFQQIAFHMWYRYSSVRASHRREEPEKVFTMPYMPRWPPLLRQINAKRIHHKICATNAAGLVLKKALHAWTIAFGRAKTFLVDEGKESSAAGHYDRILKARTFLPWKTMTKEKGRNYRRRERCFR